jgi:hypothetical protein
MHPLPALFFLVSAGRGTTTSVGIISPCANIFSFSLLACCIKEIYESTLHIANNSLNDWENYILKKLSGF